MADHPNVGAQLRGLRLKAGLTQAQVAHRMQVVPSTVTMVETRNKDLHISTIVRYCKAIGATVAIGFPTAPDEP